MPTRFGILGFYMLEILKTSPVFFPTQIGESLGFPLSTQKKEQTKYGFCTQNGQKLGCIKVDLPSIDPTGGVFKLRSSIRGPPTFECWSSLLVASLKEKPRKVNVESGRTTGLIPLIVVGDDEVLFAKLKMRFFLKDSCLNHSIGKNI